MAEYFFSTDLHLPEQRSCFVAVYAELVYCKVNGTKELVHDVLIRSLFKNGKS